MAARPSLDNRLFLVGYSDDARALLDHLQAEAPGILRRVGGVVDDPRLASRLVRLGVEVVCGDPWDPVTLLGAGLQHAGIVAVFPEDPGRDAERIRTVVRAISRLCPQARIFAKAASPDDAERLCALGATEVMVTRPRTDRGRGSHDIGRHGELAIDTP